MLMLRILFGLGMLIASPVMAATPVLVTKIITDGTGSHAQYFCDMSGIGTGPFQPVGATDANCNELDVIEH